MMENFDNVMQHFTSAIYKAYPNAEIHLFGSRARNDFKKDSDWDVLILLNDDENILEAETHIMDLSYEVELQSSSVIVPLVYNKSIWEEKYAFTPLYLNIKNESIKLL